MANSLDKAIYEVFTKNVREKKLLSGGNLEELERFIDKAKVTTEDWDLLVDKDCFPPPKEANDGK